MKAERKEEKRKEAKSFSRQQKWRSLNSTQWNFSTMMSFPQSTSRDHPPFQYPLFNILTLKDHQNHLFAGFSPLTNLIYVIWWKSITVHIVEHPTKNWGGRGFNLIFANRSPRSWFPYQVVSYPSFLYGAKINKCKRNDKYDESA
jgi:hypothetical protein